VQTREWVLTVAVIVVPLIIAMVVTLWSLDQVRYRPGKRRPAARVARETSGSESRVDAEAEGSREPREAMAMAAPGAGLSGGDERDAGVGR
jgi:hypothetical protein